MKALMHIFLGCLMLFVASKGCHGNTCFDCSMFQCDTGECVKGWNVCDGYPHCPGGEDESGPCDEATCNGFLAGYDNFVPDWHRDFQSYQYLSMFVEPRFVCLDGTLCIQKYRVCNGIPDCADGSDENICDEHVCKTYGTVGRLSCDDKMGCYSVEQLCDGKYDCSDGSDELNCPGRNTIETCAVGDKIACADQSRCVDPSVICSKPPLWATVLPPTCNDSSHTKDCGRCESSGTKFLCHSNDTCVWRTETCDGNLEEPHCPDGSDELDCTAEKCGPNRFACADGAKCIYFAQICDGHPQCEDGSDEQDCETICSDANLYTCQSGDKCLSWSYMCAPTYYPFPIGCPDDDHFNCDLDTCYQKSLRSYTDNIFLTHSIYDVALCPSNTGHMDCISISELGNCNRECLLNKGCVFQDDGCAKCLENNDLSCANGTWPGQCITSEGVTWEMKGGDTWQQYTWPGDCTAHTVSTAPPPGDGSSSSSSSSSSDDDDDSSNPSGSSSSKDDDGSSSKSKSSSPSSSPGTSSGNVDGNSSKSNSSSSEDVDESSNKSNSSSSSSSSSSNSEGDVGESSDSTSESSNTTGNDDNDHDEDGIDSSSNSESDTEPSEAKSTLSENSDGSLPVAAGALAADSPASVEQPVTPPPAPARTTKKTQKKKAKKAKAKKAKKKKGKKKRASG